MPLIQWSSDLDIGFALIDKQHKVLVEMINELYDAMMEIKGQDVLSKIVKRMVEYAAIHFMVEEKWMAEFKYDNYSEHKKIHDDFTQKAIDLKNQLSESGFVLSLDVLNFLRDWLINHIKGTDRQYISCFRENGIS